jgi:hypothetical protein
VLAAAPTPMAGHALSVEMIVLTELSHQIDVIQGELATHFGRHPDRDIYLSQPGLGVVLAARVLVEFGDAPGGYATPKHAAITPEPHPSPAHQERKPWSAPATLAIIG